MRTSIALLAAVALAVSGPGIVRAATPERPTPMRVPPIQVRLATDSVVIPMHLVEGRVIVEAMVNGKGPFPFIFDTGAHGSVMDLEFARQQGLALGAEIMVGSPGGAGRPGRLVTVDRLDVGGLAMGHVASVAFDGMPFKGADAPRGVLGPYGLAGVLVTLDYPDARLVFTRGALGAPDGREIFGWDAGQPLPEVLISVAGREVKAHLDSGAAHGLTLPTSFEKTLPLSGPLVEMGHARAVDQEAVVMGAPLKGTVVIGRYTMENPTVLFSGMQAELGNVGPPVLRQFEITIDPANRRIRLSGPADGKLASYKEHPDK